MCVGGGGGNLALPVIRDVDKTGTAAGERLEMSVWVTNCFGRLDPISPSLECKLAVLSLLFFFFFFLSDQGGLDTTNYRPVILSTHGPMSQSIPDNYNTANMLTACTDSSSHFAFLFLGKAALCN